MYYTTCNRLYRHNVLLYGFLAIKYFLLHKLQLLYREVGYMASSCRSSKVLLHRTGLGPWQRKPVFAGHRLLFSGRHSAWRNRTSRWSTGSHSDSRKPCPLVLWDIRPNNLNIAVAHDSTNHGKMSRRASSSTFGTVSTILSSSTWSPISTPSTHSSSMASFPFPLFVFLGGSIGELSAVERERARVFLNGARGEGDGSGAKLRRGRVGELT
ncbi:hypothetical protein C8J56DRAFT_967979, partial [Mycena floridula]